jgi:O-antigen biosynthesis protein WbqP
MRKYMGVKRTVDCILSALLLFFLALPMGGIALCVGCTSRGGILFRQARVGQNGKVFVLYKFRTMYPDAPRDCPSAQLASPERYVTPVGRFLRRTSLDELPQLWNVFRGQMSLVGPRPLIPREETVHELRHRYGADRLRPGITGLAQIRGRDLLDDRTKAAWDTRYFYRMSPLLDLRILLSTLGKALRGEGIQT